jgi:3-carboxy-cis,cis-muconate cycloisomerase
MANRVAPPEIFLLGAAALFHARQLAVGLQVDPDRMRANLDLTNGLMLIWLFQ